jgi:hypothetical protein
MGMPLGRYFVFTGSLLLALLFLADWYLPPLAPTPARAEVDRSIIRLHSRHKWPERIVIDTSLPTIVPPPVKVAAKPEQAPPASRSPRAAYALALAPEIVAPAVVPKPVPKRRTRMARTGPRVTSYEATDFRNPFPMSW